MRRPPVRWTDTELPEGLARALSSAGPAPDDDAALARMRARLHHSLGTSFESRRPEASDSLAKITVHGRAKWLTVGALVAAGLTVFGVHSARMSEHAQETHVNVSATPQNSTVEPAAQSLVADAPALEAQRTDAGKALQRKLTTETSAAPPKSRRSQRQRAALEQTGHSSLAEELQGIEHIRELMGESPARALSEAQAQQRRFAQGALAAERELLRVEALLRMGRVAEAKARAHGAASEPYKKQLEKLLAAHNN